MKISEYQSKARSTAIYPEAHRLAYPALGLTGELGELVIRMNNGPSNYDNTRDYTDDECEALKDDYVVECEKEMGDCLWYLANLCHDADLVLHECVDLDEDATFADISKSFDEHFSPLSGENAYTCVARIAEAVKKTLRDNDGILTAERQGIIRTNVKTFLKGLLITPLPGFDINRVAQTNIDKLLSRQERGVLVGDGDNR